MRQAKRHALILASGDFFLLLIFSWLGRITHHLPADLPSVLKTAFPFVAAWIPVAWSFRLYHAASRGWKTAMFRTFAAVLITVGLGVQLRAWMLGRPFDALFASVTFLTLCPLFLMWRIPLERKRRRT
ncbi:DUF3054 domain-containing protein [Staphylospora marina]|uniref:DUF3054 domain-containing protein n=1 Tax=Staphylospora marina TaxID=2490858 RepID=UPI0013DE0F19|nr:DUF3054 domain-containing protein [Staphylospora marina]